MSATNWTQESCMERLTHRNASLPHKALCTQPSPLNWTRGNMACARQALHCQQWMHSQYWEKTNTNKLVYSGKWSTCSLAIFLYLLVIPQRWEKREHFLQGGWITIPAIQVLPRARSCSSCASPPVVQTEVCTRQGWQWQLCSTPGRELALRISRNYKLTA